MATKKPVKKAPQRKTSARAATSSVSRSSELSYDTKLIITLLLLLFFYPLGLIFMWLWMKKWPVWLKLIISLPLILGLLGALLLIVIVRTIVHEARYERAQQWQQMQQQRQHTATGSGNFSLSPTPTTLPSSTGNTY